MSYPSNKKSPKSGKFSSRNKARNFNRQNNQKATRNDSNNYEFGKSSKSSDRREPRQNSVRNEINDKKYRRNLSRSPDSLTSNNSSAKYSSDNRRANNSRSSNILIGQQDFSANERSVSFKSNNSSYKKSNFRASEIYNSDSKSYSDNPPTDLLWGRHSTEAAFQTGRPIHRIWCTSELRSSSRFFQFLRDAKSSGVLVEEVSWARLGQITKGAVHQGIVLQTAAAETLDLKKLINACSSFGDSALLLALDGLTDPHNLGAIIRSAEALGAHGLVLPQRRSAGLTGSVAKVAAGALEHLPVARVINLNRSLAQLSNAGYKVIGLAEEGESTLHEVELNGPLVVVIGSEDKGISVLTRKHCDQIVRIPLRGVTTSLNASIATSIVLYEIAKQTWMKAVKGQSPSPKLQRAKFESQEQI